MRRNDGKPGPVQVMPASAHKPTDPRAIRYQQQATSRLPKVVENREGPPMHIPPLEMKSVDPNMTMGQQGALFQDQLAKAKTGPSFPMPGTSPGPSGQRSPLLAGDTLPPQAQQDPHYQTGMGSVFAQNQPILAYKYGVVRNGQFIPPEHLQEQPVAGRLRTSTVTGLEKLVEANRPEQPAPPPPPRAEEPKKEEPADEEEKEEKKGPSVSSRLDDFDWATFREMMTRDVLNSPEQRQLIEARLEPMDVSDLVIKEYIRQVIPIKPKKLEVTFQSSYADEEVEIKRLALEGSNTVGDVKEQHVMDRYYMMGVALGLHAVNNNPMPAHRDKDGKFSEALFLKKLERVMRLPFHMVAALGIQHSWFQDRVRKLFEVEALKNG